MSADTADATFSSDQRRNLFVDTDELGFGFGELRERKIGDNHTAFNVGCRHPSGKPILLRCGGTHPAKPRQLQDRRHAAKGGGRARPFPRRKDRWHPAVPQCCPTNLQPVEDVRQWTSLGGQRFYGRFLMLKVPDHLADDVSTNPREIVVATPPLPLPRRHSPHRQHQCLFAVSVPEVMRLWR